MGEFVKNEESICQFGLLVESIRQMRGRGSLMTRKIIFLDVDGTIIDYDNHIPESAVVAIRKARERVIWSMSVPAAARLRCRRKSGILALMA